MLSSKYRKRLAVLIVILLLLLGGVLGVTIAYFKDHTDIVKNTFAAGVLFNNDEDFILMEDRADKTVATDAEFQISKYKLNSAAPVNSNTYDVLAGVPIPKRPYVQIRNLLLDAYLFLEVTKGDFMPTVTGGANEVWTSTSGISWSMADGWFPLPEEMQTNTGKRIYYYGNSATDAILKADVYNEAVQFNVMNQNHASSGYAVKVSPEYDAQTRSDINISFVAYACQAADNKSAVEAWDDYKKALQEEQNASGN